MSKKRHRLSPSTRRSLAAGCAAMTAVLAGVGRAADNASTVRHIEVFVRDAAVFTSTPALAGAAGVSLPLSFLEKHAGFTRKPLPDGRIGVCRGDLCIPFNIGTGASDVRSVDGRPFVPISRLANALRGTSVWDDAEGLLLVDLAPRPTQTTDDRGPIEFELPDLSGRPVNISTFRGRKVILFAWASW